jgi:hypothetical protein
MPEDGDFIKKRGLLRVREDRKPEKFGKHLSAIL